VLKSFGGMNPAVKRQILFDREDFSLIIYLNRFFCFKKGSFIK